MKWLIFLITFTSFASSYRVKLEVTKNGELISSPDILLATGELVRTKSVENSSLSVKLESDGDALKLDLDLLSKNSYGENSSISPEILLFTDNEVEYETTDAKTGDVVSIKVSAKKEESKL